MLCPDREDLAELKNTKAVRVESLSSVPWAGASIG